MRVNERRRERMNASVKQMLAGKKKRKEGKKRMERSNDAISNEEMEFHALQ